MVVGMMHLQVTQMKKIKQLYLWFLTFVLTCDKKKKNIVYVLTHWNRSVLTDEQKNWKKIIFMSQDFHSERLLSNPNLRFKKYAPFLQ